MATGVAGIVEAPRPIFGFLVIRFTRGSAMKGFLAIFGGISGEMRGSAYFADGETRSLHKKPQEAC